MFILASLRLPQSLIDQIDHLTHKLLARHTVARSFQRDQFISLAGPECDVKIVPRIHIPRGLVRPRGRRARA